LLLHNRTQRFVTSDYRGPGEFGAFVFHPETEGSSKVPTRRQR
jgi:hypothetical protein